MDVRDAAVLTELERDGRLSVSDLAQRTHRTRRQAAESLGRLTTGGQVEIRGVIHPDLLGIRTLSYLTISVEGPARRVASAVATRPDVPFVSIVTGTHPVAAEVRSSSSEEAATAIASIREIPGVRTVEATRYVSVLRDIVGPIGELSVDVDDIDRRLMFELEQDGRASYTYLSTRVGRSAPATRQRVLALLRGNAIRVGAVLREVGPDSSAVGVGLRITGHGHEIATHILQTREAIFATTALGKFDVILTVRTAQRPSALDIVEEIRSRNDVRSVETWSHLDVVKESYTREPVQRETTARLGENLG